MLGCAGHHRVDRAPPDHLRPGRQCPPHPAQPSHLAFRLCSGKVRRAVRLVIAGHVGPVPAALCLSGLFLGTALGQRQSSNRIRPSVRLHPLDPHVVDPWAGALFLGQVESRGDRHHLRRRVCSLRRGRHYHRRAADQVGLPAQHALRHDPALAPHARGARS